jgi:cell division protease FtsH
MRITMKKTKPRRLYRLGILLALPAAILMSYTSLFSEEEQEWPHSAVEQAEETTLTAAYDMLHQDVEGRIGAILGSHIYVGTPKEVEATATETSTFDYLKKADIARSSDAEEPSSDPGTAMETFKAQLPYPAHDLITSLLSNAVSPIQVYSNHTFTPSWTDRFIQLLPVVIILLILALMLGRGATKSLGLSSAYEVVDKEKLKEGFDDVVGIDTARGEIQEIVGFLKDPEGASRLGGRMPKGVLFDGPPGTGKTLLARAMAKEAGVPFISIEASGVNQLFVGAGSMKIRKAFREARKLAPCIIFIDEIDAMGRARGASQSGASDEKETTLNSLLVELDGFDAREGVVLIAATNRPEVLDRALLRRGRIDRKVHINLPDPKGRLQIMEVHARKVTLEPDLDLNVIARNTSGFSGADLAALVNEAALAATRADREAVTLADFQTARNKMMIGTSASTRVLNEADKHVTAVHEAGHALIASLSPHADPIEQATILPQGGALGFVLQSPEDDFVFETQQRLKTKLAITVAGRVAEEIILGADAITSGASSDIEQATLIAREMVTRYGMSPQGFVRIDPRDPALFDADRPPLVDIRSLINQAITDVRTVLTKRRNTLLKIADRLKQDETISGGDIREIVGPQSV